ncbi:MAG: M56 family metallopeptidase, partial [Planctomycetales bacterium]|nr:M56 family metallopeptidase [Planctomycetales bacterium]
METLPVAQDALVGLAVRSLLLLIATALVAITCRRCSAALQHGIWTVGLGGCLVLPMFTWLSPGWSVPVLPAKPPEVLTSSRPKAMAVVAEKNLRSASRQVAPAAGNVKLPQAATNADKPTAEFQPPATVAEVLPVTQPSSSSPVRQAPGPGFAPILYAVWLTGVLVVTSRLAYRTFTMQRCVGRSRDVTGADWHELRSAAAQLLGVPASIPVRVLDGVASPLVTGQWRPAVLLPLDADAWSLERRRLVLLHEFAHVRRRDLWTQTMANLACAFYWFLPLAWWGERQMSRLREIACDDVVVTRCGVPAAYAQTLLEIAQRCQRRRRVSGAIAMAASSQVEGRIAAILNASRNRASLTTRSACVLGACALATATAVGTCHLSSRAAQASPDKADQPAVGETMGSTTSQGAEAQSQADIQTGPRTMTVRSLDEAGMPVPNVILHVNSWYTEGEENFAPF